MKIYANDSFENDFAIKKKLAIQFHECICFDQVHSTVNFDVFIDEL